MADQHDDPRSAPPGPGPRPNADGETPLDPAPGDPPRPPASRTSTLPGPLPLRGAAPPRAYEPEARRDRASEDAAAPPAGPPHGPSVPLDEALGFDPIDPPSTSPPASAPRPPTSPALAAIPLRSGTPAPAAEDDPRWAPMRPSRAGLAATRPPRSEPTLSWARRGEPEPGHEAAPTTTRTDSDDVPDATGAVLRPLVPLTLLLLFEAAVLPIGGEGGIVSPLRLLTVPGSASFVSAVFFVLILVAAAIPVSVRVRASLLTALGAGLLGYGLVVTGNAVRADVFDGQPGLDALFRGPAAARLVLVLAAVALPTALFWRFLRPASVGARIVAATALLLVAFAYLGLHTLGLGATSPLTQLLDAGRTAAFMGDRVAAWVALLPAAAALLGLAAFLPARTRAMGRIAGALFWASVVLAPVVLAFFVARMAAWQTVLEPVKVVTLLAAGLLLVPAAVGTLLATFESAGGGQGET